MSPFWNIIQKRFIISDTCSQNFLGLLDPSFLSAQLLLLSQLVPCFKSTSSLMLRSLNTLKWTFHHFKTTHRHITQGRHHQSNLSENLTSRWHFQRASHGSSLRSTCTCVKHLEESSFTRVLQPESREIFTNLKLKRNMCIWARKCQI